MNLVVQEAAAPTIGSILVASDRLAPETLQRAERLSRESGDPISAEWVAHDLPEDLRKTFARYLAPGDARAPILLARIDLVTLGTEGSSGGGANGTQAVDYIQGAGIVLGPGGRQIAAYPFFTAVHAYPAEDSASGVSGRTRVSNLALSFANFLPGKMGLQ